jgi:hypothetical protein
MSQEKLNHVVSGALCSFMAFLSDHEKSNLPTMEAGQMISAFMMSQNIDVANPSIQWQDWCSRIIPTPKEQRHVVKALACMNPKSIPFIHIENKEEIPGVTPVVCFIIQSDPVSEVGVNGCQAQDIIEYSRHLIQSLNNVFPCEENVQTIKCLDGALAWQDARTQVRINTGVEGKMEPVPAVSRKVVPDIKTESEPELSAQDIVSLEEEDNQDDVSQDVNAMYCPRCRAEGKEPVPLKEQGGIGFCEEHGTITEENFFELDNTPSLSDIVSMSTGMAHAELLNAEK